MYGIGVTFKGISIMFAITNEVMPEKYNTH